MAVGFIVEYVGVRGGDKTAAGGVFGEVEEFLRIELRGMAEALGDIDAEHVGMGSEVGVEEATTKGKWGVEEEEETPVGTGGITQGVHEQRLEAHRLMSVPTGLKGVEQTRNGGAVPASVATGSFADEEIVRRDGGEEDNVVVEVDIAFAEAGDAPQERFDGIAVEGGQAVLVPAEDDGMIDDFVRNVSVGEVATEEIVEVGRHLMVGDEEDASDEGCEAIDGGDTVIDFPNGRVASGPGDVVVPVFAV